MTAVHPPEFATQLVGSWCKPKWLCDHDKVYGKEGTWWRLPADDLPEAQDDSVRLAVFDQNRAGLTYATDGECRRQTFSGHFYCFEGIDSEEQGAVTNFSNDVGEFLTMKAKAAPAVESSEPAPPPKFEQPRVVAPLRWTAPILANDVSFLRTYAANRTKTTIIGPISLGLRVVDEFYGDQQALTFALADVINAEIRHLETLGVDLIQIDEPEVHFRYSQCKDYATEAIDRTLAGVTTRTSVHVCYGYSKNIAEKRATPVYEQSLELLAASCVDDISLEYEQPAHGPDLLEHTGTKGVILGVLNLDTEGPVESVEHIESRAKEAIEVIGPDRLRLGPDCGMWFLPRDHAFAKISHMEQAARRLRSAYA